MKETNIYIPTIYDAYSHGDEETKLIIRFYYFENKEIKFNPEVDFIIYFLIHFEPECLTDIYAIKHKLDNFMTFKHSYEKDSFIISNKCFVDYYLENKKCLKICHKNCKNEIKKYKDCEKLKRSSSKSELRKINEYEQYYKNENKCNIEKKDIVEQTLFKKIILFLKR